MSAVQLLLVAGTHGNEINAPWLIDQWAQNPNLINTNGLQVHKVIGNPAALQLGKRYLDRDLNRSFSVDLFADSSSRDFEISRAIELLSLYGSEGRSPCQIVIDLHSTTAAMGSSLVVYGRRPSDLALASLVQSQLGLPIYLHEGDNSQRGFLVESWPCGFVIEIGPVSQGMLHERIIQQTKLILEILFMGILEIQLGKNIYPDHLIVHRHLQSIDFPRNDKGEINAFIHSELQGKDWIPLRKEAPLFLGFHGEVFKFKGEPGTVPVFINEVAYAEKKIALSLTKREVWPFQNDWIDALDPLLKYYNNHPHIHVNSSLLQGRSLLFPFSQ